MKDSKLVEIISTFSNKEMKSFEKMLESPFFERDRDVSGLFSILKKHHPEYGNDTIAKEKIFRKLFPGENFNEKKLKNLTFELTKLAEQFLVHNKIKLTPILRERLLAYELKHRSLDRPFTSTINTLEKLITSLPFEGRTGFKEQEEWSYLKEDFLFWKNEYEESIKYRLLNTEYIILSFVVKMLQRMEDKVIITTRYNKEFKNPVFDSLTDLLDIKKFIEVLKKRNYEFTWLIEIYYFSYLCTIAVEGNEKYYTALKDLFYEHIDFFSSEEKLLLFSDLTYYCIIQKEKGNQKYSREEFELYKKMIDHYPTASDTTEYFHIVLYRNILVSSMAQGEFEWLEKFAAQYTDKLPPELRENMMYYVKAYLHFGRKEYEEALDAANKIKYDIFLYKLDVKNLMIKIYYELDMFDQAFSAIDSYKHFLSENKEHTDIYREHYGNFINIYIKLLRLKEKFDDAEFKILSKKVESTDHLASRIWVREKILELSNIP